MKITRNWISAAVLTAAVLLTSLISSRAVLSYWDPEGLWGTNGGAATAYGTYTGGSLAGVWETASWSRNTTGGSGYPADQGQTTPIPFTENDAVVFAVGGGCTNFGSPSSTVTFDVTMNANHTVAGFFNGSLNPNSCIVTIDGTGIITIPTGLQGFSCHNSSDLSQGQIKINVPMTGPGAPTLQNNGQFFFNATNTYSGGTYFGYSGGSFTGTLNFNSPYALGGNFVVSNTLSTMANFFYTGTTPITLSNKITWAPANAGLNILSVPGGMTFTGTMAMSGISTNVNLFITNAANVVTFSNAISGGKAGGLFNKGEAGTLRLCGTNSYVLTTTVSNGLLQAGNASCIPNGSGKGALWVYNPGTFDLNGFNIGCNGLQGDGLITNSSPTTNTFTFGNNNAAGSFSGNIQSSAGYINLTKAGTNLVTLSGNNSFLGNVTINGGTLSIPAGNTQIPSTAAVTIASGATLDVGRNDMTLTNLSGRGNIINNAGTITITGNFVTNGSQVTYSGFSGNFDNGALVKNGTETMAVRGTNNNLAYGVQLNSGALVVGAGTNRLAANGSASLTIGDNGIFELAGSPGETVSALSGTGYIDLEGGALIVNASAASVYSGVIRDSEIPGSSTAVGHGLRGYYYNHQDFTALAAIQDDATINIADTTQTSNLPPGIVQGTNICIRWVGQVLAPADGSYTFSVNSDDGCRLWVNGQCIVDNWVTKGAGNSSGSITLSANTRYDIIVEYFQQTGGGSCKLLWTAPGAVSTIIPTEYLFLPGAGSVVKDGTSPWQLNGTNNTYTGGTLVKAGTLHVSADHALGSGTVTILDGATLLLDSGTLNDYIGNGADLVLNGSAQVFLNFTGTDHIGRLSFDGGATYQAAGTYGALGSGAQHEDSHFNGSGFVQVGGLPSTVTLNASTSTAVYGSPILLTAAAHGSAATPTGTITFLDGASPLATVALDVTGSASLTVSNLSVSASPHSITAFYSGNVTYSQSTSPAVSASTTPLAVTGITGVNKVYDQTTTATLNTNALIGILPDDTNMVQIALGYTANFSDKNAATNKPVSASGLSLTGLLAADYSIPSALNTTADITPKTLAVTNVTASAKIYDGTASATIDTSAAGITGLSTNVFAGDDATPNYAGATGVFPNFNVGTSRTVNITVPFTGADGEDYVATGTAKANITQATAALAVNSSANPANVGDSVDFTATASAATGGGTPTGSVTFLTNGVLFATTTLTNGFADAGATTALPQGTNTITAQYAGDVNFVGYTNSLQQVINSGTAQPTMTISQAAGQITISWSGNFNLQSLGSLQSSNNNWQTISGAVSPYTTSPTNSAQFYRLSN